MTKEIGFKENIKCEFCDLLAYYKVNHVFNEIGLCQKHYEQWNKQNYK